MVNAKFTQKVEQYLATAAELAQESSHQQLSPVHLAIAMFEDPEGIGKQSAVKAGGEQLQPHHLAALIVHSLHPGKQPCSTCAAPHPSLSTHRL